MAGSWKQITFGLVTYLASFVVFVFAGETGSGRGKFFVAEDRSSSLHDMNGTSLMDMISSNSNPVSYYMDRTYGCHK